MKEVVKFQFRVKFVLCKKERFKTLCKIEMMGFYLDVALAKWPHKILVKTIGEMSVKRFRELDQIIYII